LNTVLLHFFNENKAFYSVKKGAIGIVGGMGPAAGVDLAQKIISNTKAKTDQDHLDQMLFSFPKTIDDRTDFIIGKTNKNPGTSIAEIILKMEKAGAVVAGLACNSAHAPQIFDQISAILKKKNSKIKLLHMIREVAFFIKKHYPDINNIGIMGTTGTYTVNLFDLIEEFGFATINISKEEQHLLHSAIYDSDYGIKSASSKISHKATSIITEICSKLKNKGAELIVFGCTEIPIAYNRQDFEKIPLIDPGLVLARALINEVAPEKLTTWHHQ